MGFSFKKFFNEYGIGVTVVVVLTCTFGNYITSKGSTGKEFSQPQYRGSYKMNNVTIGYLNWKRHSILSQTLSSHKSNGLFDLIKPQNRIIFFQELSKKDIDIANNFECAYLGDSNNNGILDGFIKLVEKSTTEYFIFSENDWYLIENKDVTIKILEDCIELLNGNLSDIVRLRHRKNPGNPLYSQPTNLDEWLQQDNTNFPYKLESLTWVDDPNNVYNNELKEFNGNYKWYITTLNHQKWSNNIFIAKTSYLRNVVLPLIRSLSENNNVYTGLEDVLINYNNYLGKNNLLDKIIKSYSETKISAGNGLFTHKDFV